MKKYQPEMQAAIEQGRRLVAALGPFDIGQGVVVGRDGIVAIEGARGTDAMLRDLAAGGPGDGLGRGAVLVKLAKPGQEMRIDLPTIGLGTIQRAAQAGLAGVAGEVGRLLVLDREAVIALADELGIFVVGVEPPNAP